MEENIRPRVNVVWLRRDLRLEDNAALYAALKADLPVVLLFVFDRRILERFSNPMDKRLIFIYKLLKDIDNRLQTSGCSLLVKHDFPEVAFESLAQEWDIGSVYVNRDYEPEARQRDHRVQRLLQGRGIGFHSFKDQVIFEEKDILKKDASPYTVFTPYANEWRKLYQQKQEECHPSEDLLDRLYKFDKKSLPQVTKWEHKEFPLDTSLQRLHHYDELRNFPAKDGTTRVGIHLRFGSESIRKWVRMASKESGSWLNQLIWREFFMMILFHFPEVVSHNFRKKYDRLQWRNDEEDFRKWCLGETGYPMIDAGMRELRQTGWMHNRIRMLSASFLTKHLLIDWRWGEAHFANYLLDYELASNNGNWQWAAGTGCDAAPYFRIFNPDTQLKKFDPNLQYVKQWIPEYRPGYIEPIVSHKEGRERALHAYKQALYPTEGSFS